MMFHRQEDSSKMLGFTQQRDQKATIYKMTIKGLLTEFIMKLVVLSLLMETVLFEAPRRIFQ